MKKKNLKKEVESLRAQLEETREDLERKNIAAQRIYNLLNRNFEIKIEPPIGLVVSGKNNDLSIASGSKFLNLEIKGEENSMSFDPEDNELGGSR